MSYARKTKTAAPPAEPEVVGIMRSLFDAQLAKRLSARRFGHSRRSVMSFTQYQAGKIRLTLALFCVCALLAFFSTAAAMTELNDKEMSNVSGQALLQMDKEFANGFTFYKAGLDAVLELNLNIEKLQLGCGGINGAVGCDLDADNFALGCIADAGGNCTYPGSTSGTQMKDLVMTRPYFQFAIKNDDSKTLREVVGVRLGGENVEGPMSIGNFNSFSGYLSASANFTLEAQGTTNADDIAVTCGTNVPGGCPGPGGSPGYNDFGLQGPLRSLGLANGCECVLGICASYEELTVKFGEVTRLNRPVVLEGNRQTQALVSNAQLATAVEELVETLDFQRSSGLPAGLLQAIKFAIEGSVIDNIQGQLAAGFGIPVSQLENYKIPYNISNLHSVDVDTPLFGLSFQRENVQYPGYAQAVPRGWAMYLPDAFTLNVSEPTTVFVNNIVNGNAAAGNIVPLPVPGSGAIYDNCWGEATFC